MRPFSDEDFPLTTIGSRVYRKMEDGPICIASTDAMAQEIAKRMNRDNQVYPDPEALFPVYGSREVEEK